MKLLILLTMLVTSLYVSPIWAQCGAGVNTGGQCVPPDVLYGQTGQEQPQPQRSTTSWARRWGAIVYDDEASAGGASAGLSSKSKAKTKAIDDCISRGGKNCKIVFFFHDQCAAVASSSDYHAAATAATSELAEKNAISDCGGGGTCKIIYSECSLPQRVR